MAWLFDTCAQHWAHASAACHRWRGLALYGADGTTLRVSDSAANRVHFGLPHGGPRGPAAYPQVRLVALAAPRSHLLAADLQRFILPPRRSERRYPVLHCLGP